MAYGDASLEIPDTVETETCVGCGLTVEVESPVFLDWDVDVVGLSTCPDCRGPNGLLDSAQEPEPQGHPSTPRRAA